MKRKIVRYAACTGSKKKTDSAIGTLSVSNLLSVVFKIIIDDNRKSTETLALSQKYRRDYDRLMSLWPELDGRFREPKYYDVHGMDARRSGLKCEIP